MANSKSCSSSIAVTDGTTTITIEEIDGVLARVANALVTLSRGRAAPVAVVAENCTETLVTHAAAVLAGVSAVAVNPRLTADELDYILADSGAAAVVTDGTVVDAGDRPIVSWATRTAAGSNRWCDVVDSQPDVMPPSDVPPKDTIVYTSGTTGRPKATLLKLLKSAPTVAAHVDDLIAHAAAAADGPHLVAGPLHHASPLVASRYLLAHAGVVVMPRFDPIEMLTAIDRYRVASTMVVPTHLNRLVKLPADVRARFEVSSLRWVAHTGAPCPPATKRQIIEWFGPVVVEIYGGSEAGVITMINSQEWLARPGSVGRAIRRYETVVVDDDGCPLPSGQVGRLFFRDRTGRGIVYEGDPDKTAQAHLAPGVFTIGELGYVDSDGYLFIADRRTDLILSGGANVYPAEIERVLLEHPDVVDAVVIGRRDEDLGEIPHAIVQPRDPLEPPSVASLDAHCATNLARYKRPRSYEFIEEIPRNSMGKVNRQTLRDALAGPAEPSDPAASSARSST